MHQAISREARQVNEPPKVVAGRKDFRTPFQHDYDRIIHSSALRRLAGVTQVVNPSEGQIFHNRLTHTIKVAQIARRLAERFLSSEDSRSLANKLGGLDADVVETAALAHDLGHPPFGHVAEVELNRLVKEYGGDDAYDGYEGNAQSFRIVTRLAVRTMSQEGQAAEPGLNLTYASLNAILKYPWPQNPSEPKRKWGVYQTEQNTFDEVRQLCAKEGEQRSLEAELMDWADDIAYAFHDLEDFYRANLIPLDQIRKEGSTRQRYLDSVISLLEKKHYSESEIREAFEGLSKTYFPAEPFFGTREETALFGSMTSSMIHRCVFAISLNEETISNPACPKVRISRRECLEVNLLQHLTRFFVIDNPSLASQQAGQTRIIETLFKYLFDITSNLERMKKEFPLDYRSLLKEEFFEHRQLSPEAIRARVVADKISSMTDQEALKFYRRIMGIDPGSVLDRI